jgi:hypothetical protein
MVICKGSRPFNHRSCPCQREQQKSLKALWAGSGVKLDFNLEQIARIDFFNELYYYQGNKELFKTLRRNNYIYY